MNVVDSHYHLQDDTVMPNETYVVSETTANPSLVLPSTFPPETSVIHLQFKNSKIVFLAFIS